MPEDAARRRSELQEALLHLYLRLNGYFVTSFIVHSPIYGRNVAQIDGLGVRLPYSCEPEREVGPSPFLEPSADLADLLICEVKSKGESLQFNESFREDVAAITTVLRWSGLFQEAEILALTKSLQEGLTPTDPPSERILCVPGPRNTRVRAIVCSPERRQRYHNQPRFIDGSELFAYITRCLCPAAPRRTCSVRYDLTGWGRHLEPLVRFFKNRGPGAATSSMSELYQEVGVPEQ